MLLQERARHAAARRAARESIAVIGADATEARLGGYSGPGIDKVSILDGIRAQLGARRAFATPPGPAARSASTSSCRRRSCRRLTGGATVPGLARRVLRQQPRSTARRGSTRTDARIDFGWTLNSPGRGIPFDWYSVRWTGTITAPAPASRRIGVEGNDGYRLYLDDKLVIDNWRKQSYGTRSRPSRLRAGLDARHPARVLREHGQRAREAGLGRRRRRRLARERSTRPSRSRRRATSRSSSPASRKASSAIARCLKLPGRQEELIERVAATGKPTVVVLVGGSAITMRRGSIASARSSTRGIRASRAATAVADVLFGDDNPAGRLPITFPMAEGQLPLVYNHKPTGRGDDYVDLTGQPLFPFGFGLSYTTFEYSDLRDRARDDRRRPARRRCAARSRTPATRAGDEVVQLYMRDVLASVARPVMELKASRASPT